MFRKKIMLVCLFSLFLIALLSASTQRVAVLDFEPEDRASRNITNQMMNARRGDFVSIFAKYSQYELINLDQAKRTLSDMGISGVRYITSHQAAEIGEKLNADVVIWGSVSDVSATEVRILSNVMSVRSKSINQESFNAGKKSSDRQNAIQSRVVDKVAEFAGGELLRLFQIGEQHLNTQNYSSARDSFMRIVEIDPNNLEGYFYLGYIAFMVNDFEQSEEYYLKGLALDPQDDRILNNLAETQRRAGKHEDAIENLKTLAEFKEDEQIWFRIANLYLDINDTFDAIEALKKSIEINPEYERSQYRLGILLFDNDYIPESIPHLEFSAERFPEDDLLNRKLTTAYMRTGKLDQAIQNYISQIDRNPKNESAYLNLAGAYRTKDMNKDALEVLKRLEKISQENHTVYIRMADVNIALGNLDEAEKNAQKAIAIDESVYEPYLMMSQIFQIRAYTKYEKFLELDEKAKTAYGAEADALVSQRDKTKNESHELFVKAGEFLDNTLKRTDEPSVRRDVSGRRTLLNQLIEETKRTFFD